MDKKEKSLPSTSINWYPGHMAKTRKEIIENLKLIDVVVELLDARIPVSSRNPEISKIIQNKKRIVALNKSDLADDKETNKWIQKFKKENIIAVSVNSNTGEGINKILSSVQEIMKDEMERQAQKGRIGKTIRIMIVGIPNVGKSSFINRISKKTSAEVGNRPGVTKQKQWIRVNERIELLDTPGVLWPKFESEEVGLCLAYTGSIKEEILEKVEISYHLLKRLKENYLENVKQRYKINDEEIKIAEESENEIYSLMEIIAKKRGALISGGNIDEEKTASIILEDFRSGKIGKITLEKA